MKTLRRQGYHFRRQAPLDQFIVDFACVGHRLVIEIDGIQHDQPEHKNKDSMRDAKLRWLGYNVLRFSNSDVMDNIEGTMLEILAALGAIVRQD